MPGITLEQAQAQLDAWLAASLAVAGGQSYTIGNRTLARADAAECREMVQHWQGQVKQLTPGTGGRVRFGRLA